MLGLISIPPEINRIMKVINGIIKEINLALIRGAIRDYRRSWPPFHPRYKDRERAATDANASVRNSHAQTLTQSGRARSEGKKAMTNPPANAGDATGVGGDAGDTAGANGNNTTPPPPLNTTPPPCLQLRPSRRPPRKV